ncbi:Flowering time control protein FCA [Acorus calamus]|uniref:Flowering time control protein FCA n=1 Tax=Acorus calamus TaxID=4465 RepID=A0AAV9ESW1_ACOCL|nr:Flowering time control protein FCA [Acorus calamus]
MGGLRRGGGPGGGVGRGGSSPDKMNGRSFAKLFIGSVPKTATEEDVRPMFEEHGNVIEVALIRDKRTGQQQGCCFVKYATSEEADMAIRYLHNQRMLPGGLGPIQVRYADGERERLVEFKLFVGSLNKQAAEKEIEEIFSPYGRIEDVYIMRDEMKQSRGCAFVKFSNREMAVAAINALNGIYVMHGCEQPLIVRFADPKRPRPGESRGGPAFGGPGFGSRSEAPYEVRPTQNFSESEGGRIPSSAWQLTSPPTMGSTHQVGSDPSFESHVTARGGALAVSSTAMGGNIGGANGSFHSFSMPSSSNSQQAFSQSMPQLQSVGQQISPMQKPPMSPQDLPSPLQLQHQQSSAYSQSQMLNMPAHQLGQFQIPHSVGLPSFSQTPPSQQFLVGPSQQFPTGVSQPMFQPSQQFATQGPQMLQQQQQQQQQAHAVQSSLQSSHQASSQLQQQLHLMQQPSSLNQQQNSQTTKVQSPWTSSMQQTATTAPASTPMTASATPAVPASSNSLAPLTCNWTEHTSPEGFKYYYNSVTCESKWEKPEELTLFEQHQQQQKLQQQRKPPIQQLQPQLQSQPHTQALSAQQISQVQQVAPQIQIRQQPQLRQFQASGVIGHPNAQELDYAQLQASNSIIDQARIQQGIQAAQEWMWKNKPAGG